MKIPATLAPEKVVAICDTREQLPFDLSPLVVVGGTLSTGDYSIVGLEDQVVLERKSLDDLAGCVGRERERFERELDRLRAYPARAVVVEGGLSDIYQHKYKSRVHPNSVVGSIASWVADGVAFIFCDNRTQATDFARRFLYLQAQHAYQKNRRYLEQVVAGF